MQYTTYIVIALFLLTCAGNSTCQVPPAATAMATAGVIMTPDSVLLYYQVRGNGPDTLVVLHGGPGLSSAYLAPDLDLLAGDYTLIHYDQRGAGRSTVLKDPERLRMEDHVTDVEAVRHYFGLNRITLLGHSWGAAPAAFYALAYPKHTARIILLDPVPPRRTPYMQQFGENLQTWMDSATQVRVNELYAARTTAEDPVAACRAFWSVFIRGYLADPDDPTVLTRMRGDVCDAPPEAIRNGNLVYQASLSAQGDWDWRDNLHEVDVPVLVIHGDKDPIPLASASEWQEAIPGAELVVIEGSGHFPHFEQPAAFVRAVEGFLR